MSGSILLVRHGETEWNRERRNQGHFDSPLTERGIAQAHAIGRLVAILPNAPTLFSVMTTNIARLIAFRMRGRLRTTVATAPSCCTSMSALTAGQCTRAKSVVAVGGVELDGSVEEQIVPLPAPRRP